ncbi:MAG: hypothetical protein NTV34_16230, partial [Proteobacteria bacterium]|nr:hypothetical protein [Pseudomonadota bacterium]
MRNLLRVLVLGLTACLVDLAIAGDYVSLEKVTHFSCSGQDGPDNYVVDVTKVGKHIYNVRASQVEDGVARLVFKMKAAYKT